MSLKTENDLYDVLQRSLVEGADIHKYIRIFYKLDWVLSDELILKEELVIIVFFCQNTDHVMAKRVKALDYFGNLGFDVILLS